MMVRARVRSWLIHHIYEGPHKVRSTRIFVCACVCICVSNRLQNTHLKAPRCGQWSISSASNYVKAVLT